MQALNTIDPENHNLSTLNDNGIKELHTMWRENLSRAQNNDEYYDEKEINILTSGLKLIKDELDTRGHIPTKAEKKAARQEKAKRGH